MWIKSKRGILVFSLGRLRPLFLDAQQAATEVPMPLRFDSRRLRTLTMAASDGNLPSLGVVLGRPV